MSNRSDAVAVSAVRAVEAFQRAAARVPAYRQLLGEAGIDPAGICTPTDLLRLPVLDKHNTFQRFPIHELCLDGQTGELGAVLTSSGHSGVFAFGLSTRAEAAAAVTAVDAILDSLFQVRSRRTLLINCLPMGVRIDTRACTAADTSVRPDMAVGLVAAFARYHEQILLVGETAFIKQVLELGQARGLAWERLPVNIIVGEEVMAENARLYLESVLGNRGRGEDGHVLTSMGIGELGLNLFFEAPPPWLLRSVRHALHRDPVLRAAAAGPGATTAPLVFTYDPERIYVEFTASGQLLITSLDPERVLPLIRYAGGDSGAPLTLTPEARHRLATLRVETEALDGMPVILMHGRGKRLPCDAGCVYPEQVKEGLYHDPALARLTTANFRVVASPPGVRIRIQLRPDQPPGGLDVQFHAALAAYVTVPFTVCCEPYATFGSGMALDYERKFDYLGP